MSGTALVRVKPRSAVAESVEGDETVIRLREARSKLATADFDSLFSLRAWAEVVATAGRAKRAGEVAREAVETRVRADRRLGELLAARPEIAERVDVSDASVQGWVALAKIPATLFERVVTNMVSRDLACAVPAVVEAARRESLRAVEPGILVAWDTTHYVAAGDRGDCGRLHRIDGGLIAAREDLRRRAGLKKGWQANSRVMKLDDAHARTRQISLSLDLIVKDLTGDERAKVYDAMLKLMGAAEDLFDAHRMAALRDERAA